MLNLGEVWLSALFGGVVAFIDYIWGSNNLCFFICERAKFAAARHHIWPFLQFCSIAWLSNRVWWNLFNFFAGFSSLTIWGVLLGIHCCQLVITLINLFFYSFVPQGTVIGPVLFHQWSSPLQRIWNQKHCLHLRLRFQIHSLSWQAQLHPAWFAWMMVIHCFPRKSSTGCSWVSARLRPLVMLNHMNHCSYWAYLNPDWHQQLSSYCLKFLTLSQIHCFLLSSSDLLHRT